MVYTIIYGAQSTAVGVYEGLYHLNGEKNEVSCFLVSSLKKNPNMLKNLPVYELGTFMKDKTLSQRKRMKVYIATPIIFFDEIEDLLVTYGIEKIIRVDKELFYKFQRSYSKKLDILDLDDFEICNQSDFSLEIFQAVHHKDKVLTQYYKTEKNIHRLQVGAALSKKRFSVLCDDIGISNISKKNGDFSEITGLYWIWKNRINYQRGKINYYGLYHYRRVLNLATEKLANVDIVLPYPMPCEPNITQHAIKYITEKEWEVTLQVLEELHPNQMRLYQNIIHQRYLYNYNIFVAKDNVLSDYCQWLFPILFKIEEKMKLGGKRIPNRYIGYIAEILETIYFMSNKQSYTIAHCSCFLLV
ncbi:MAG: hypothetical protein PWP67_2228 [Clostridium butyricum]|uniref:DUF4422 domain-containing protein n=1 Tax=Enterococcus sp. TaxID=35783 RepID=UPI00258EA5DC|nr:DUF4422 domain-containing protein [Enterococcus sp.]MDK2829408.1 hypothetical protein [Clostridium butyricum]MDK2844676.1 hypothetical protein [Enterococcus sp.]